MVTVLSASRDLIQGGNFESERAEGALADPGMEGDPLADILTLASARCVRIGRLRQDGTAWSTDKDGLIMAVLAAEITARTGKDPGEHYRALTAEFGTPYYARIDAPATPAEKAALERLSPDAVKEATLAGEPITAKLTRAPGNDAPIGGLKVVAGSGWFAARPSGTENLYKVYVESFKSEAHLETLLSEAQAIVSRALEA